jgi:hypothetical protein
MSRRLILRSQHEHLPPEGLLPAEKKQTVSEVSMSDFLGQVCIFWGSLRSQCIVTDFVG